MLEKTKLKTWRFVIVIIGIISIIVMLLIFLHVLHQRLIILHQTIKTFLDNTGKSYKTKNGCHEKFKQMPEASSRLQFLQ